MSALDSITKGDEFAAHMDILSRAIQEADRLLKQQFRMALATTLKKRFVLITLNEIVRKCKSAEAMSSPDIWTGIPVVARSAFESYADLHNCLKCGDDYAQYMMWVSLNHQLVQLRAINSKPDSRFFRSLTSLVKSKYQADLTKMTAELKGHMDEITNRLPKQFKDRKGKVIKREIFRFQLAGLLDEYDALYRRLSGGAHGRISDIISGVVADEGYQWPPGPADPPIAALGSLCDLLIDACKRSAKAYRKPIAPIASVERANQELRRALYG